MMKLAKSIATVSTALTFALCLAGGARAQANTEARKPALQNANAKPSTPSATKPKTAAPIATKPGTTANAKPTVAKAAVAKPAPVNPTAAKAAVAKPVAANPMAPKPITAKPVALLKPEAPKPGPAKAVAAKPVAAKPIATKPAPPKPSTEAAGKTEKPVDKKASADETPAPAASETLVAKRDPFVALVNDHKEGGSGPALPPGKAGLVVATVRVDGTVRSGEELIAVVSNPEKHVYFIREGDQLYDGNVKKIDLEGVTFQENSKDAFGKPVERQVTKRIYASAGEQQ